MFDVYVQYSISDCSIRVTWYNLTALIELPECFVSDVSVHGGQSSCCFV